MKIRIIFSIILSICIIICHCTRIICLYIAKKNESVERGTDKEIIAYKEIIDRKKIRSNNILSLVSIYIGYIFIINPVVNGRITIENIFFQGALIFYLIQCIVFLFALWCYHKIPKNI